MGHSFVNTAINNFRSFLLPNFWSHQIPFRSPRNLCRLSVCPVHREVCPADLCLDFRSHCGPDDLCSEDQSGFHRLRSIRHGALLGLDYALVGLLLLPW